MVSTWASGLAAGLVLFIALGAQTAFVLRQGLRREHVGMIVMLCIASDVVLVLGGALGVGAVVSAVPSAMEIGRWGGVIYLIGYAVFSFCSAFKPTTLPDEAPRPRSSAAVTVLALTFLNPHAYLDTVLILGTLANNHGSDGRWMFSAGALTGSVIWFCSLGYGGRALSKYLKSEATWRIIDIVCGVLMLALAGSLAFR